MQVECHQQYQCRRYAEENLLKWMSVRGKGGQSPGTSWLWDCFPTRTRIPNDNCCFDNLFRDHLSHLIAVNKDDFPEDPPPDLCRACHVILSPERFATPPCIRLGCPQKRSRRPFRSPHLCQDHRRDRDHVARSGVAPLLAHFLNAAVPCPIETTLLPVVIASKFGHRFRWEFHPRGSDCIETVDRSV